MRVFKPRHRAVVVLQCAWRCFGSRGGAEEPRRARALGARLRARRALLIRRARACPPEQAHARGFLARQLYARARRRCSYRRVANFRRNVARARFVKLRGATIRLEAVAR